ncbi:MAG: D-alanyl-D-alanine carboxypeptidase/D-alanyl-D-alanine-endopeptidase [Acidobacteria bacterium]|nr:D-alanyl-D-alanine carboxypeptidase/D-alanyl-D-alanine-endopeptidase [Acidobacteriota bacterium]
MKRHRKGARKHPSSGEAPATPQRNGARAALLLRDNVFLRALMLSWVLLCPAVAAAAQRETPVQRPSASTARSRRLVQKITTILRSDVARQAHWGIQVVSLDGDPILNWNEDKLFVPASAAKLFTTAAALMRLGPDFRYKTTAEITAPIDEGGRVRGDLVIVGRGDPNLSARVLPYNGRTERTSEPTKSLQELTDAIMAQGIHTIDGGLVIDDSYFVHQPYQPGWSIGDMVWGFGAPISALSVNDNVVVLTIVPGERAGDPALITQQPLDGYFEIENHVVTIASGPRRLSLDRQPGSHILQLWGEIPLNDPGRMEAVAMDDPARFAVEWFRAELARRGIQVTGALKVRHLQSFEVPDTRGAPQPPATRAATVVGLHESAPLIESLQVINKVSQNLHSEMLLRTLGRERRNVGSSDAGLEEVRAFLAEAGIKEEEASLRDGSGLSRNNLLSPAAMVKLLHFMYSSQHRDSWVSSLPVSGVDGSLFDRFRTPSLRGQIYAKTGSVSGVAALAGYIIPVQTSKRRARQEPAAFAIFMNNGNMTRSVAAGIFDELVEEIYKALPTEREN